MGRRGRLFRLSVAWEAQDDPIIYDSKFKKLYKETQKDVCKHARMQTADDEDIGIDLYGVFRMLPSRYVGLELHEHGMACGPIEGIFFCVFDKEAKLKPRKEQVKSTVNPKYRGKDNKK